MVQSISLTAYMAWARRNARGGAARDTAPPAPRPAGELIWGHADTTDHAHALVQLVSRLRQFRPDLSLVLTCGPDMPDSVLEAPCLVKASLPEENVAASERFLDHWQPDLCLWTGGDLQPALLTCADRRGVPLYLVDASRSTLERPAWRWFPDLPRALLNSFAMILAQDAGTERALLRMGVRDTEIAVTGIFQEGTQPLPCDETERNELAALLGSRPVWLAAMAREGELDTILSAHRKVTRMAHRLMLILVPARPGDADSFAARLDAEGFDTLRWSDGALPEDTTQIILGDTQGDMGLWYRLATISLMGSSLVPGFGGRDPNEPAAHGSAILYGPNVGRYLGTYRRFADAGAARIVRDTDTLAAALGRLIAPDQSAAMAHAAWDVASVGAQVTDRIIDLVQDTLDVLEAH